MNKIKLLASFLLMSLTGYAQFPGNHPELLLDKIVIVSELSSGLQKYGYKDFHKNDKMKITDTNIKHELLSGKNFKVTSVEPYDKYGSKKFKIKLESETNGTYYYDYDPRFSHSYYLKVEGGLTLPEGIFCEEIKIDTDKFTGEIRRTTPPASGVTFTKVVAAGKTTIYMQINEIGSTLNVGKKGLILLLENGKRIEKPEEKVDAEVNKYGSGYIYSVFTTLTESDIKLLCENVITDNRLYIYDGTINKEDGNKIKEYLKCLIK